MSVMPSLRAGSPISRASSARVATLPMPMVRNTFLRNGQRIEVLVRGVAAEHVAQQHHGAAAAGDEAHAHLDQAHVQLGVACDGVAAHATSAPPPSVRLNGAVTTGTGA